MSYLADEKFIKIMKKFIVLYHSPSDLMEQNAQATREEQEMNRKMWRQIG
jgi:hypothetical protein